MYRLFFLLIFLFSCSDDSINNNQIIWIKNLVINIDRLDNELYIQAEAISQDILNEAPIDSVTVNLEYSGSNDLDYNKTFLLYDNGQNGDMIAGNGIFTLIDSADQVESTSEQSNIININFPVFFELSSNNPGIILFDITIKGKKYLATASLFENGNIHILDKYVNIDNTQLEIHINKSNLYIDDDNNDDLCNRIYDKYENIFHPITFDWPEAQSSSMSDYFKYESGFAVTSVDGCASTGQAIFRFILNDLDTGNSVQEDRTITLYGCGDGICEEGYESINTCFEDCNND